MVLRSRDTFYGRCRYLLTSAHLYEVAHCPESGFDRLFDITFQIYRANSDIDVDLSILSFVSRHKSERVLNHLLI